MLFGKTMGKSALRAEALGCVDELNAALGLARVQMRDAELVAHVDGIQTRLFGLMGELAHEAEDAGKYAAKGYARILREDVAWLEGLARAIEAEGVKFTGWAVPGGEGSMERAALDFARTAARRAERTAWRLDESGVAVSEPVRIFLNRLSDFLWILARRGG